MTWSYSNKVTPLFPGLQAQFFNSSHESGETCAVASITEVASSSVWIVSNIEEISFFSPLHPWCPSLKHSAKKPAIRRISNKPVNLVFCGTDLVVFRALGKGKRGGESEGTGTEIEGTSSFALSTTTSSRARFKNLPEVSPALSKEPLLRHCSPGISRLRRPWTSLLRCALHPLPAGVPALEEGKAPI